ncbi:MAG: hypothetical protein NTW03_00925 [Verrucomicrobia bacterium]|nr:hypothetical protein [Verrucomicrobiota bacterium]
MLKSHWLGLAGASLFILQRSLAAPYADAVTAYQPGTGFVAGYTDPTVALGQPGRPDPYATPDDPFDPAWHASQIVSVGTGGFLTVRFDAPIQHHPSHPYGIDFLIFGNAGFIVTNEDYIGTLATDGSLFGASSAGSTRVWVSQDGVTFYQLNPSLAPVVDNLFPTDGAGDLQKAVSSFLRTADFAGQTLDGIRVLYAGSGGGAGFNLAWAQDTNGQPVNLSSASYVRVNVLSGHAEIDGFAAVASPEVAVMAEDFSSDPATRGWRMWGDPSLFHWNADSQRLEVTWDSSRPNSYCFRLLEVPLSQSDDFSINFDLRFSDIAGGVRTGKPGPFEIALGLINKANATNTTFARGRVGKFPNLCEFEVPRANELYGQQSNRAHGHDAQRAAFRADPRCVGQRLPRLPPGRRLHQQLQRLE